MYHGEIGEKVLCTPEEVARVLAPSNNSYIYVREVDGVLYKICKHCQPLCWQPIDAFMNKTKGYLGKGTYCKPCCAQISLLRYANKRSHLLSLHAAWREANREHCRAYRERYAAFTAPEVFRSRRRVQNSKRRASSGYFTVADLDRMVEEQNFRCFYCRVLLIDSHLEHKQPLSRGGTNNPDNLCMSCASCNLHKGTKTAEEFVVSPWFLARVKAVELRGS